MFHIIPNRLEVKINHPNPSELLLQLREGLLWAIQQQEQADPKKEPIDLEVNRSYLVKVLSAIAPYDPDSAVDVLDLSVELPKGYLILIAKKVSVQFHYEVLQRVFQKLLKEYQGHVFNVGDQSYEVEFQELYEAFEFSLDSNPNVTATGVGSHFGIGDLTIKVKCTNARKKARMLALLVTDYMIRQVPEDKNAETHKTMMRLVGHLAAVMR